MEMRGGESRLSCADGNNENSQVDAPVAGADSHRAAG
jgi:hypothetical protein